MQYTIVDDDGKAVLPPTRPCKYHGLAIDHLPTWTEGQCKQQSKSLVVPVKDHWKIHPESREHRNAQNFCCKT